MSGRNIPRGRYRSHQNEFGDVWFYLEMGGRIEVKGSSDTGYKVMRTGPIGSEGESFRQVQFGQAGAFFMRRKNAENYALIAALAINGDMRRKDLVDPGIYGGQRYQETEAVATLRRRFWTGPADINVREGWADIDPDGILSRLPHEDPFCLDREDDDLRDAPEGSIEERNLTISTAVSEIVEHYWNDLGSHSLAAPYERVAEKAVVWARTDMSRADWSYAKLLAIAALRHNAPLSWFFPGQTEELRLCLQHFLSDLPSEARSIICEPSLTNKQYSQGKNGQ